MDPEFTPGDRIEVIRCTDPYPIPNGATGTVTGWNPHPLLRQLIVAWDPPHDHCGLMLTLVAGEPGQPGDLVRLI